MELIKDDVAQINDEPILQEIREKKDITSVELSILFFSIFQQLSNVEKEINENINDYFDSLKNLQDVFNTKDPSELQELYKEHKSIINTYTQNNELISKKREELNNDINLAITQFKSNVSINSMLKIQDEDIMIKCPYPNICASCRGTTIYNTKYDKYTHCYNCEYCKNLRKVKEDHEKKIAKNLLIQQLDEEYNKKHPNNTVIKSNKKKAKLITHNININNTYIQINTNQTIFNQICVKSKDRFFEVFIKDFDNNIENIKHVFIYYMCRAKAYDIFPLDKIKINYSTTYPLAAGLYTINNCTLHGLLRYKNVKSERMTLLKLQNITKNEKINITVKSIKYREDVRDHHSIEDLTSVINNIISTNSYGSNIEHFYISDL